MCAICEPVPEEPSPNCQEDPLGRGWLVLKNTATFPGPVVLENVALYPSQDACPSAKRTENVPRIEENTRMVVGLMCSYDANPGPKAARP